MKRVRYDLAEPIDVERFGASVCLRAISVHVSFGSGVVDCTIVAGRLDGQIDQQLCYPIPLSAFLEQLHKVPLEEAVFDALATRGDIPAGAISLEEPLP